MKSILKNPYFPMTGITTMLLVMSSLDSANFSKIIKGLYTIYTSPDILITDYIELAGLSSAFANSAIMGALSILLFVITKHKVNQKTMMAFCLMCGFSFFGKNLINTLPIILGGFLYSKYTNQPFGNNIVLTLLSTGLAPAVMQIYYFSPLHNVLGILLSILLGAAIGFATIPVAKNTTRIHTGHNLYNSGFSAGLIAMLVMALFRGLGVNFTTNSIWSEGNNSIILLFIVFISSFLILTGIFMSDNRIELLDKIVLSIFNKEDSDDSDVISDYLYINMGVLGLFACIFVQLLKVELSGPVLGAIFTIIGFGCYGKSIKNILPIMIGSSIAGAFSVYGLDSPSVIIAILFSSCLAPIVRDYGAIWGVIAGIMHVSFVMSSGDFYGGLNLYNNGLAGGFVAIILVPLIEAINSRKE